MIGKGCDVGWDRYGVLDRGPVVVPAVVDYEGRRVRHRVLPSDSRVVPAPQI